MKASDVVNTLKQFLPLYSDTFASNISVDSITRSGTTATVITSTDHGLSVGDPAYIKGSLYPAAITEVVDDFPFQGFVMIRTDIDHDQTLNPILDAEDKKVRITGPGAYDETFKISVDRFKNISGVVNRFVIVLEKQGQPLPSTNESLLVDSFVLGYNGVQAVTAINSTTEFEFELSSELDPLPGSPAQGAINLLSDMRVTRAADVELADAMYTKQGAGQNWLFVVMDDTDANKSRDVNLDADTSMTENSDFRHSIIETFHIYAFIPNKGDEKTKVTGGAARDAAIAERPGIFSAILGQRFDEGLKCGGDLKTTYAGDGFERYDSAYYVHRFSFQQVSDITLADSSLAVDVSVAFRDIDYSQTAVFGDEESDAMTNNINLDDDPSA